MSQELRFLLSKRVLVGSGKSTVTAIDPERLKKWIDLIVQFLPIILSLFKAPTPPDPKPPVQAGASITTLDGLVEFVEKQMELRSLTEDQQAKVLNAVEALAAFLSM